MVSAMKDANETKRLLWNLLLLAAGVVPAWIILMGVLALLIDGAQGGDLHLAALFYFIVLIIPVLLGGMVHQLLLLAIPRHWPALRKRLIGVAISGITIPSALLLTGTDPQLLAAPLVWVPLVAVLLAYGWILRLPEVR
jgi:hypothetical protein